MHLADRLRLPSPYSVRPYAGRDDLAAMARVLAAYRSHIGDPELPTVEQMEVTYANLQGCDPDRDIAIVECGGELVAYSRTSVEELGDGNRDGVLFSPVAPEHLTEDLFVALAVGQEEHLHNLVGCSPRSRYRAYAAHPGPGRNATGEAAWLEALGYDATEWGASLVRPNLDDIPERPLPEGVEVRPVLTEHIRPIIEAHLEAFRGEWDFREPTEADYADLIDHPDRDETLWKVAWAGDEVVGQVKPYINREENESRGTLRGYTEYISTHRDWRNRGIAGALLPMALRELRDRGMTEAVLGVDTNNPGGAFQLYTGLGFELRAYEAVYTKRIE